MIYLQGAHEKKDHLWKADSRTKDMPNNELKKNHHSARAMAL